MLDRLSRGLWWAAACALLAVPAALAAAPPERAALPSAEEFRRPGPGAGVHAWWHWVDGAITREGITKDLEALHAQGVVQVTILNVGLFDGKSFGVPRVAFATPEWFSMYRWALAEAHRLGMTVGVHNCDGWSSSGGPWITPEQSMKQFVWTKTIVAGGGPLDLALAEPLRVEGFYRDVAVVAWRTNESASAFRASAPRLRLNDAAEDAARLFDGCPVSAVRIRKGDRLVWSAAAPLTFDRVAVHVRRPFMWGDMASFTTRFAIEASADGREYTPVAERSVRGLNRTEVLDVPPTTAPFVRLLVRDVSETDAWIPVELGEAELLRAGESPAHAPTIPAIAEKTSAAKGESDEAVFATAADAPAIPRTDVLVLTDRMGQDGRLRWSAPAGSWAVLRFGYTSTGATNAPATPEGRGLECDKMDPAAVEHHFRSFPQRLIDEAGELAGGTLRFVLVDSWEAGFQNWTARLPEEFEKRHGYGLVPWLPVLTGETVGSPRESEAALYDFRRTIADLIRESYYERFADLLHGRGVELHAEVIYGGAGYPPLDVLRSTRKVDLPMWEFWTSTDGDSRLQYTPAGAPELNLPAAAAAGYGKPFLGSEAYTGMAHYSESFAELKPVGDRAYCAGVNRMILHSSVHQPTDERPGLTLGQFGSHFNRNNSTWSFAEPWLAYQARIQSVLGQGAPVFDVLYFLGDQLPQSFGRNASTTLPAGYVVDAVNAEILGERVAVVDGRLRLDGTTDAALLSLPPQPAMSVDTLKRVAALVREGAHVYGPRPERTLSMADTREAAAFRALADEVWGVVDGKAATTRAYGKGRVSWGRPLGDVLAEQGVRPQFAASPAGAGDFLFVHRRVGDADVFFVVNQQDRALSSECSFRVGGKAPEIWDPETGGVTHPAVSRVEKERLTLPMRFGPRQALLFVFRPGTPRVGAPPVETVEALAVGGLRGTLELRGPGAEAVRPIEIDRLRSLTEFDAPEVRYFSGDATYRLRFRVAVPELAGGDVLRLDVGDFESVAEVTLNGRALGKRWRPGQDFEVTGVLRSDNELVVRVANVYRNRFIGDLVEYGAVRNLRTSSPIGDFLSRDKPLKRSGLLGPITVTRVRRQVAAGP